MSKDKNDNQIELSKLVANKCQSKLNELRDCFIGHLKFPLTWMMHINGLIHDFSEVTKMKHFMIKIGRLA